MKKSTQKHSKTPSSTLKYPSTKSSSFQPKNKKSYSDNPSEYKSQFFNKNSETPKTQKPYTKSKKIGKSEQKKENSFKPSLSGEVRLNRYIANCGICSRREADELIKNGLVKVNGKVVTELGTKVTVEKDEVKVNGKIAKLEQFVYILLNKPKNCITTVEDEKGRTTVMDLIKGATDQRVYPVGRLDRNTTGLLLITNDGELAKVLSHPSSEVPKVYYAKLNKPITNQEIEKLLVGIELEDGFIAADRAGLVEGTNDEVGIEIHSGRNHIVKRMFQAIGYEVVALDRVSYGFLNKKGLKRGTWRYLTEKEIAFLKMNYLGKNSPARKNQETLKQKDFHLTKNKQPLDFVDEFEDFHFDEKELENLDFSDLFNEINEDFDEKEWAEAEEIFLQEDINFDDL